MTLASEAPVSDKKPALTQRLKAWWDGREPAVEVLEPPPPRPAPAPLAPPPPAAVSPIYPPPGIGKNGKPIWSATRIDVAEKMWGEGFVQPGGGAAIKELAKPLGLSLGQRVLNLGCGPGGAAQYLARKYAATIDARDFSPILVKTARERIDAAQMGGLITVDLFEPNELPAGPTYDCIFSQDSSICAFSQEKLFEQLAALLNPGGQLMFLDYFLGDDADAGAPALTRWREAELQEMRTVLVSEQQQRLIDNGFEIRITEDRTSAMLLLVNRALAGLHNFLTQVELPPETRTAIAAEINLWDARAAAINAGLRYYMFLAAKEG